MSSCYPGSKTKRPWLSDTPRKKWPLGGYTKRDTVHLERRAIEIVHGRPRRERLKDGSSGPSQIRMADGRGIGREDSPGRDRMRHEGCIALVACIHHHRRHVPPSIRPFRRPVAGARTGRPLVQVQTCCLPRTPARSVRHAGAVSLLGCSSVPRLMIARSSRHHEMKGGAAGGVSGRQTTGRMALCRCRCRVPSSSRCPGNQTPTSLASIACWLLVSS